MDVEIVKWPEGREGRDRLARAGRPRLLVVDNGFDPPVCVDVLEDWVRVTDHDRDAALRAGALAERWVLLQTRKAPRLHDQGMLEYRSSRTEVSPLQARLMRPMVDQFGQVVTRGELAVKGWQDACVHRNTLDAHMSRLRQRIGCVGLTVRTVRSRGYLLAAAR